MPGFHGCPPSKGFHGCPVGHPWKQITPKGTRGNPHLGFHVCPFRAKQEKGFHGCPFQVKNTSKCRRKGTRGNFFAKSGRRPKTRQKVSTGALRQVSTGDRFPRVPVGAHFRKKVSTAAPRDGFPRMTFARPTKMFPRVPVRHPWKLIKGFHGCPLSVGLACDTPALLLLFRGVRH